MDVFSNLKKNGSVVPENSMFEGGPPPARAVAGQAYQGKVMEVGCHLEKADMSLGKKHLESV